MPAKPVLDVNRIYWKLKLPHRRESQTPHLEAKMILTNCAACAAPLAHDAPRCVRCQTRYCSELCLRKNAHRGGHDEGKCAAIDRGGGAEQYYADKKYKEAVAEAVEACAADTIASGDRRRQPDN